MLIPSGWPAWAAALTGAALALALSTLLTRLAIAQLEAGGILDRPNERSSHSRPTPRGGGWGIVLTVLPLWAAAAWLAAGPPGLGQAVIGCAFLVWVSWQDDRRSMPAATRLIAQAAMVFPVLWLMPEDLSLLRPWLPLWLERLGTGIGWLWYLNLNNFMDGIDGLAGTQAVVVGTGIAAVALLSGWSDMAVLASILAGAAAGFLVWNWQPARVFMGDVGSVPLGYLKGYLLILLGLSGALTAAAILPLYFIADATLTLLRRLRRGERLWEAHCTHWYQRAVRAGISHAAVVRRVLVADLLLLALALGSLAVGWPLMAPALVVVGLLLWRLGQRTPP